MRLMFGCACLALALVLFAGNDSSGGAQQKGDAKYTISDVMKKAHAGKASLLTKVKGGKATPAEAKELLEMYEALAKNTPPQGDAASWKKRCEALIDGAKLLVDGKKDDAVSKLNDAANCVGCHKAHKG